MDATDFLKKQVPLFKDFAPDRLNQLVHGSIVGSFEPKEAIMHRGEEATHFGVVLEGTVGADGGNGHRLGELKAGDTFAELS